MGTANQTVTTAWTPPPQVTGFSITVNEDQSTVSLDWDTSTLVTGFAYYQVYRQVAGDVAWTPYDTVANQPSSQYTDYNAGQGVLYNYKVTQLQTVPGDANLESSDSDIIGAQLQTDTWFVIGADLSTSHIFELPVISESHTQPIQQEIFEPIGSTRKTVARGSTLGFEGSLTMNWQDTDRQLALTQIAYLANNAGPHTLKSPFGDVWHVEFNSPTTTYIGAGHVEVVIPWIEIT